jgi:hypothetical protein
VKVTNENDLGLQLTGTRVTDLDTVATMTSFSPEGEPGEIYHRGEKEPTLTYHYRQGILSEQLY